MKAAAVQPTSRPEGLARPPGAARRALRITPVALAALMLGQPALSANRVWNGGAGAADNFWDLAANWGTGVPGPGDIAKLGAFNTTLRYYTYALQSLSGTGTLTMDSGLLSYEAASSVGALVLNGGSLGGKGTLTTGAFTWNGGNLGNTDSLNGTINVNGAAALGTGAVTYGQTLNLNNNSSWNGSGYLYLEGAGTSGTGAYNEAIVNLAAGKTLTLAGGTSGTYQLSGPGTFNNAGTITKTGSNTLYIDTQFNNSGTLNANGGETQFYGTRTLGGTVNVASGATLHFNGDTTFASAATIAGAGNFIFDGTNVVASGTRTFGGAGSKTLASGFLGGAGTIVFNKLDWTGGTMGYFNALGGTTTVNGTTTLGNGANVYLSYGRKLNLNGDVNWAGSGQLYLQGAGSYGGIDHAGSVLSLAAGKTMNLQGSAGGNGYYIVGGSDTTFNNAGTITKTGSNTLQISGVFNNTGTLNANGGETTLYIPGTLGGTINVASGAALHFGGETTFDPAATIAGDGNLFLDAISIVASGTRTFGGAGTKTFAGSYMGGAGTMVFNNLTWAGYGMGYYAAPGGVTTINGTTTLTSSHYVDYGRTVNFNGDVNWAGSGNLFSSGAGSYGGTDYGASVINLAAGKTFSLQGSDAASAFAIYAYGGMNNAGIVTKTGANPLYINGNFNNTGTLNINGGEAYFGATGTLAGTVNVASGTTLHFNGTTTFAPTATIAGNGNLVFEGTNIVASGTRTFGGTGTKTLAGGTLGGAGSMTFNKLVWTAGMMGDASAPGGTTTVTGITTLNGTAWVDHGRTLKFNGEVNWTDGSVMYVGLYDPTSVVTLAAGKTMNVQGQQILGFGTFNNAGTISKTGAGDFYIGNSYPPTFNNTGILVASGGVTYLAGGTFNNTGTLHANGGRIQQGGATLSQWSPTAKALTAGTYRVTGTEPIVLNLGYLPGTGTPALIKTNRAKIYLEGAGAAIISQLPDPGVNALKALTTNQGVLSLTGGATLDITASLKNKGTGSLIVGSGSTLTLKGGSGVYSQFDTASTFVGGTLTANTMTLGAGSLSAGNGAGLVGNGVLNASVGGVTLGAATRYDQDVTTAGWDKLSVATGNIVVDGTLQATFGAGVTTGNFRFLTSGAGQVLGTFDSVVSNLDTALYTVSAIYGAKYVDLKVTAVPPAGPALALGSVSAVPEPQTYALLAAGLALMGWKLRRPAGRRARG